MQIAQNTLLKLQLSNQDIENYAELANYYSIQKVHDLKFNQAYLYICQW